MTYKTTIYPWKEVVAVYLLMSLEILDLISV